MKSQKQQIRTYLEMGKKLTAMDALNLFGCWNLKGRIYDIRKDYHDEWLIQKPFSNNDAKPLRVITTEMITIKSGKRIAEYSIKKVD